MDIVFLCTTIELVTISINEKSNRKSISIFYSFSTSVKSARGCPGVEGKKRVRCDTNIYQGIIYRSTYIYDVSILSTLYPTLSRTYIVYPYVFICMPVYIARTPVYIYDIVRVHMYVPVMVEIQTYCAISPLLCLLPTTAAIFARTTNHTPHGVAFNWREAKVGD